MRKDNPEIDDLDISNGTVASLGTMDDSLEDFMKPDNFEMPSIYYEASRRFISSRSHQPVKWKIQAIDTVHRDQLLKACKKKIQDPATRNIQIVTDSNKFTLHMILACVKVPNLNSKQLQDSWKVREAESLIRTMLTPGEYDELGKTVMELNGYDVDATKSDEDARKIVDLKND